MLTPISWGTFCGATMSSERSTLVRRWPSEPDLLACWGEFSREGNEGEGRVEGAWWVMSWGVKGGEG